MDHYSVQYVSHHVCSILHSNPQCITALATQTRSCSPRRCPRPVFVYDTCVSSQARSIEVLTEAHARTQEGHITYPCDGVLRVAGGEPCECACGKPPHEARRPVSCFCVVVVLEGSRISSRLHRNRRKVLYRRGLTYQSRHTYTPQKPRALTYQLRRPMVFSAAQEDPL